MIKWVLVSTSNSSFLQAVIISSLLFHPASTLPSKPLPTSNIASNPSFSPTPSPINQSILSSLPSHLISLTPSHSNSTKTIQPTKAKPKHRTMHSVSIRGDRSACSSPSEGLAVEEWHFFKMSWLRIYMMWCSVDWCEMGWWKISSSWVQLYPASK